MDKKLKYGSPLVCQHIRNARLSAHLSLEMLGRLIGISNQALSAIERGKANPSKQTLISLAKTLRNDFGESWLTPFVIEAGESSDWPGFPFRGRTEPQDNPYLERVLDDLDEAVEAAKLPKPVGITKRKMALLPIHFEIREGALLMPSNDTERILVPVHTIHSIKKARLIRVIEEPIRHAFIGPGDIIVLNENSEPEEGKVVLALAKKRVVIGEWKSTGKGKVTLEPRDHNCKLMEMSSKQVEFVGELTDLIPSFQLKLNY